MKRLEKLSMVAVMLLLSVTMAFAQQKPNIHILPPAEPLPEPEHLQPPPTILPDK